MFTLPKLDYAYDAFEPHISAQIMELHHSKHHQAYVDKLNTALEKAPEFQNKTIEDILQNLDKLPEEIRTAVRNNGGGHYNHSLFWKWLSPSSDSEPQGKLAEDLANRYGSFSEFKEKFAAAGVSVFGSGWVWLMPDLSITTSPNQDNPISQGQPTPLFGIDVWEHAYYLDYKNKRPDYLTACWNVIDWVKISKSYGE